MIIYLFRITLVTFEMQTQTFSVKIGVCKAMVIRTRLTNRLCLLTMWLYSLCQLPETYDYRQVI